MERRIIRLDIVSKRKLKDEMGVSRATVDNALNFRFNSDKAKRIRNRALEMLEAELETHKALAS